MSRPPTLLPNMRTDEEIPRCCALVWKRDTYRRTGRGPSGFEMHYNKCQCERAAKFDGRCWQHKDKSRFNLERQYFRFMPR